ncbi:hypothetical protein F1880_005709 [Penicillium rolfsii]|nr:hypothetical protein F1880_005709 [Penicillium rolfsii]
MAYRLWLSWRGQRGVSMFTTHRIPKSRISPSVFNIADKYQIQVPITLAAAVLRASALPALASALHASNESDGSSPTLGSIDETGKCPDSKMWIGIF